MRPWVRKHLLTVVAAALVASGSWQLQHELDLPEYFIHPDELWSVPGWTLFIIWLATASGVVVAAAWALLGLRNARGWPRLARLLLGACLVADGIWVWADIVHSWIVVPMPLTLDDLRTLLASGAVVSGLWMLRVAWRGRSPHRLGTA